MYKCKIAERLVELRTSKGVTQEDVAQSLSISNKTISKWENSASMPDLSMFIELSKYYGVTTDSLLGLSAEEKQSTKDEIRSLFEGLDHRKSVIKAFEAVRALIPTMYETATQHSTTLTIAKTFSLQGCRKVTAPKSRHTIFSSLPQVQKMSI